MKYKSLRLALLPLAMLAITGAGCGKKDELDTAAPPPSANAQPAENVQKNLPGRSVPGGMQSGASTQGAAAKPLGQ